MTTRKASPADTIGLEALVGHGTLVVCVGPGGVGKTTVSAALGLAAARAGRKTLVLTIDPARRLAQALGLDGLDDTIRRVPLEQLSSPPAAGGSLWAAMVDTGKSYDALIERVAPDAETKTRFVIVDAVGVTEHPFVEPPLNRDKSVPLKKLLQKAAMLMFSDRLVVAPDCGMKYMPRHVAFGKLKAMCDAAATVRKEIS